MRITACIAREIEEEFGLDAKAIEHCIDAFAPSNLDEWKSAVHACMEAQGALPTDAHLDMWSRWTWNG